jgi:carbonic anhydrase
MGDLAAGVRRFQQDVFPGRAGLFGRLATTHQPGALFIGCSDARVVPELITQSDPGELFVIRTAGNIVPPADADADGVVATIEYAVELLGVSEVVVCGHSACGAMTAVATGQDLSGLPALAGWLRLGPHPGATASVDAVVRANVLHQLGRLTTHPAVAAALTRNAVTLRGWVFDIGSGAVDEIATIDEITTDTAA